VTRADRAVAVVVVTHNSETLVEGLVESLSGGMDGVPDSRDATVRRVREVAPDARVVETGRNGGYAAGINAGVTVAPPHSAVLVLNPDVRLDHGCALTLLGTLSEPGCGIAVPLLRDARGERIDSQRREPTILRALGDALLGGRRAGRHRMLGEIVTDGRCYDEPTTVDWAEGSTMMVSAECWSACGPWDESYFLYSEETDFALRARDAGYVTRYEPGASAVHLEGGYTSNPALWTLLVLNKVRLYGSRHGRLATAAFWSAVLLREGTRGLAGSTASRSAARALLSPTRLREQRGPHTVAPVTS
jgi:GT2 family glycosyltransferase